MFNVNCYYRLLVDIGQCQLKFKPQFSQYCLKCPVSGESVRGEDRGEQRPCPGKTCDKIQKLKSWVMYMREGQRKSSEVYIE